MGISQLQQIRQQSTTTTLEPYNIDNSVIMMSAFSNFYQLDSVGLFQEFFATVFPILFIVVAGLVLFNVLNWILVQLGLKNFQMGLGNFLLFCLVFFIFISMIFYFLFLFLFFC